MTDDVSDEAMKAVRSALENYQRIEDMRHAIRRDEPMFTPAIQKEQTDA